MEAIDVAERTGLPLVIAGIVQDRDYFDQPVEPRLDGEGMSYVGPVGPDRRGGLVGGARALLHLVNFDEPFGFSVVEAMACGTPVIARRRGSMAEISVTGRTVFLSIPARRPLPPSLLRALSTGRLCGLGEGRFDAERMVDDYLALYQRVVELHRDTRNGIEALR